MDDLSILSITISDEKITAEISDGHIVSIPIAWFPRLAKATLAQLKKFDLSPSGYGIHWPDVDEGVKRQFLYDLESKFI